MSGRARVYLCNVNLLDAAVPRNLAQHAAVAAAHHQHRLWLILQLGMHILINKGDISFYTVVGPPSTRTILGSFCQIMHMKHNSFTWGYASCTQHMQRTAQVTDDAPATGHMRT